MRRYLTGFGPARPADVATWAGMSTRDIEPVLARLSLRRFRDEAGNLLVDIEDGLLPPADTPAAVRFLSTWDAMLLVHARSKAVLPEEYRSLIFTTKLPQSMSTFMVDGAVAGAWRYDGDAVELQPFRPLTRREEKEVRAEADAVRDFHRG
jgi:hypothetical protein